MDFASVLFHMQPLNAHFNGFATLHIQVNNAFTNDGVGKTAKSDNLAANRGKNSFLRSKTE